MGYKLARFGLNRAKPEKRMVNAEFSEKLAAILFVPMRYKVLYGGRGAGRSWGCARALLALGMQSPLRVLCVREVQKSIKDSVHRLLSDQISLLGIGGFYDVQEVSIKGRNGTEFIFAGLSNLTVDSIKSYEGIDICWAEEAQAITHNSWNILIPTIRKDGSEIWITFNPSLETDPTYVRFVKEPPPDTLVALLNYSDNPFFPSVLESERLHCMKTNPDDYPNIWEGECRPAVEGAIYFREIQATVAGGRVCHVPYDPLLLVHVVFDLGFTDHMSIGLIQKQTSELRVIEYIQDTGRTLDYYSKVLKEREYNWGRCWLPHDGYSTDYKTGLSSDAIMRRLGWDVPTKEEIATLSIAEGIRTVKMTFPRIYFDKDNTPDLIECLKRYRRKVNKKTLIEGPPLHDGFSDGADMLRYVCVNAPNMDNDGYFSRSGMAQSDDYDEYRDGTRETNVSLATGY